MSKRAAVREQRRTAVQRERAQQSVRERGGERESTITAGISTARVSKRISKCSAIDDQLRMGGERGRGTACADVAASAIGAVAAAVVACEFQSPLSQPVASIDSRVVVVVVVARICQ